MLVRIAGKDSNTSKDSNAGKDIASKDSNAVVLVRIPP